MDVVAFENQPRPVSRAANTFAGIDLLRGLAALGVVMLHACVPYAQHPMPGLCWPVWESGSLSVDWLFWAIEIFIMPLFLLIAGFLSLRSLLRSGPASLVRSRLSRLGRPFLFGCLLVLPIELYIWVLGWVGEGVVPPVKLRSLKFEGSIDRHLWGTSHLWFLLYLLLYVSLMASARWVQLRYPLARVRSSLAWVPACLIGVASVILVFCPEVVWGFQHGFLPVPSKWAYSGAFFAGGAWLACHDPQLSGLQAIAPRLVAPAGLLVVAAVLLGRWQLSGGESGWASVALAVTTVAAATLVSLALLGVSVRHHQTGSAVAGYLAAASFWIYLVHHPLLGLIHIDLKWLLPDASGAFKAATSCLLASLISLATYEAFVRKTRWGRWLGLGSDRGFAARSADEDGGEVTVTIETDVPPGKRAA